MSVRLAPRLLTRYTLPVAHRRGLSSPSTSNASTSAKKMTAEEIEAALEKANETMKAYYSYPPDKVISAKKAKFNARHRDNQFYVQLGLGECHLYISVEDP